MMGVKGETRVTGAAKEGGKGVTMTGRKTNNNKER